jgi:hypothetical protein
MEGQDETEETMNGNSNYWAGLREYWDEGNKVGGSAAASIIFL